MSIGIISDTHDNLPLIAKAVELFNAERVEMVLHAGDFVSPFTANVLKDLDAKFAGVFGNNDGDKLLLHKKFEGIGELHEDYCQMALDDKRIVLMHQPKFLDALIASGEYDLIVYGHTHEIDIRQGPTVVVNPGECSGWLTGVATVAIMDMKTMIPTISTLHV